MLVRRFACLGAAIALVGFASIASAEQELPSDSMLSAMGLSGIQVMSEGEAMTVRGLGYGGYGDHHYKPKSVAIAYGASYAKVATHGANAGSYDGFYAAGTYKAYGAHGSVAGVIVKKSGGGHGYYGGGKKNRGGGHHAPKPKTKKIVAFSGGFSFSNAK